MDLHKVFGLLLLVLEEDLMFHGLMNHLLDHIRAHVVLYHYHFTVGELLLEFRVSRRLSHHALLLFRQLAYGLVVLEYGLDGRHVRLIVGRLVEDVSGLKGFGLCGRLGDGDTLLHQHTLLGLLLALLQYFRVAHQPLQFLFEIELSFILKRFIVLHTFLSHGTSIYHVKLHQRM